MSLRDQLNQLLPTLLPSDPKSSIKGTELIRLVQLKLDEDYSDASLRYHFSIMSCDPTSPIAKVEKGQGYYLRSSQLPALSSAQGLLSMKQGKLNVLDADDVDSSNEQLNRLNKFNAIVQKYSERLGRFPFIFHDALSEHSPLDNLWKFPEITLVEWDTVDSQDGVFTLDPEWIKMRQNQGVAPYSLKNIRLRTSCSVHSYREDFFQTLSASGWSHSGYLYYANTIEDEALQESLRLLSQKFGIGVVTFGLSNEALDDLPSSAHLLNAQSREIDALMERIEIRHVSQADESAQLDLRQLKAIKNDSLEISELFKWIHNSLENGSISIL